jgi:hypothetical protein
MQCWDFFRCYTGCFIRSFCPKKPFHLSWHVCFGSRFFLSIISSIIMFSMRIGSIRCTNVFMRIYWC